MAKFAGLELTIGVLGQLLDGALYIDEACEAAVRMGRN